MISPKASGTDERRRFARRRGRTAFCWWMIAVLMAATLLLAGCSGGQGDSGASVSTTGGVSVPTTSEAPVSTDGELAGVSVDVHNSVGCGCCHSWAAYLRERGATVSIQDDPDLDDYRESLGVPAEAAGCHTAIIEGYVVEGHVPSPAIVRLLADRTDVVGIAVPGMPGEGPGMGGDEATWNAMEVLLIGTGGDLTVFDF